MAYAEYRHLLGHRYEVNIEDHDFTLIAYYLLVLR